MSRRRSRTLASLCLAVLLTACGQGEVHVGTGQFDESTLVATNSGPVRGVFADDHRRFAGIPYAAPPLGALRWRAPAAPQPWEGERDASKFGPRCVQGDLTDGALPASVSEDCLTLNVWTPRRGTAGKRPVMVWIHGGSFTHGGGDIYDGRRLAVRGDVVVVTFNYRLGALGFLAHPALADPGTDAGNYGFADQQAALRWVRDNIANFGGDPGQVTVAGESAGGMSVCDHLVAPGSAGLFRAAIIQSGPCQAQADRVTGERVSVDYASAHGCPDVRTAGDCLREMPAARLVDPPWFDDIGGSPLSGPLVGTRDLPVDPVAAIADGRAARVPVMIGTTRDEFTLFVGLTFLRERRVRDVQAYPAALSDVFGAAGERVASRYPLERYGGDPALAFAAAVTDSVFACPAGRLAGDLARTTPVYGYRFDDRAAPVPDALDALPFPLGASHTLELPYLFDIDGVPQFAAKQRKLSDRMVDYWSTFVRTGAPGVVGGGTDAETDWPVLNGGGQWMSLQAPTPRPFTGFDRAHQCAFWASIPR